jgi:hypothetical protein
MLNPFTCFFYFLPDILSNGQKSNGCYIFAFVRSNCLLVEVDDVTTSKKLNNTQ